MTRNYVNGFFTKCAEHGVPYEAAVGMFKMAASNTTASGVSRAANAAAAAGGITGAYARSRMPGGTAEMLRRAMNRYAARRGTNEISKQPEKAAPRPRPPAQTPAPGYKPRPPVSRDNKIG